ncbi:MAG: threonine dehydratase [Alphaproteobacteria bacterium]
MTDQAALETAGELVHSLIGSTPQLNWPLLSARCGTQLWVKHENHNPTGAFKIRGGLVYMDALKRAQPDLEGVVCATRGNHGQSIATAASQFGLEALVVVPRGNSKEKNAAMTAQGGALIEHGDDFQEALEYARGLAEERKLHMVGSFQEHLVLGVATYAMELLGAVPDIDTLYVPIGLGSGICGAITARNALGLKTGIVGVVSENAPTYALSFKAGRPVSTNSADTMADGMACRVPVDEAVATINRHAERIVEVSEAEIKAAMRHFYTDTHNIAEGAGAAALAALLQERQAMAGKRIAVVLSGGNIDIDVYRDILAEG